MNEEERNRVGRRISEIDRELQRLSADNERVREREQHISVEATLAELSKEGNPEAATAMLARLRSHFQIIATELLTRQAQCERLAEEAAEAAQLIARLEGDRG
jgi:L-aminopeptidase/D-esterase-like protein